MKEYNFIINGNEYTVSIESVAGDSAEVVVNGSLFTVEYDMGQKEQLPKLTHVSPARTAKKAPVADKPTPTPAAKPAPAAGGAATPFKSPLPGLILDVKVKPGDSVAVGDTLVILEAMKMENNIDSDKEGVVKSVEVNQGDSVLEGDVLIVLE